jgi:hypothetical protein
MSPTKCPSTDSREQACCAEWLNYSRMSSLSTEYQQCRTGHPAVVKSPLNNNNPAPTPGSQDERELAETQCRDVMKERNQLESGTLTLRRARQ